jgi:tetratricopeptide (TPR) repeat protein
MGRLHAVAHQAKTVQGMAALVLATLLAVSLQSQQAGDAATLHGTVRDSKGKPVAAYVLLQAKGAPKPLTTYADSQGNYSLVNLRPGVYALHAEMTGFAGAEISTLFLSPKEVKTIDLTLAEQSVSTKAPEFFDQPQFTVAGVTDTTSLGGHGSDTVVRTRETIAKDTASLGKTASSAPTVTGTEKSLREKLVREPNSADLHHSLADLEEKLGNSLEAVRQYQSAAELDPREPYLFDWGSELLLHHAPEPAVEVFSKGNRLFPHSVRMLVGLGAAWFARGDVDQAVKRICAASDLNPGDSMPYLFLGKMQAAETTPPPDLVEKLHRFATLQPENAEANYYYAVGLWKRRANPPDANVAAQVESLLNKAIRLDPKYSAAYLQLGIVDAEQRDSQRAIANYQRAIQAAPQMEEAHYRLAQAYRQIGEADKAKAELQIYDQMSKESAENSERERHEIRQFVYTLRDPAPAQDH